MLLFPMFCMLLDREKQKPVFSKLSRQSSGMSVSDTVINM